MVERTPKQYDHAHTSHRSTSSVGLAGDDGEVPTTRAATELMHDLRRKNTTTISPALWLLSFEEKIPLRFPLLCGFFHFFSEPPPRENWI